MYVVKLEIKYVFVKVNYDFVYELSKLKVYK